MAKARNLRMLSFVRSNVRTIAALLMLVVCTACAPSRPPADTFAVSGYVHAGPWCPVMREPPDPGCADRPVADAEMIVVDAGGAEVVRESTDQNGRFVLTLPAGTYTLIPRPVRGLMGTAPEQSFTVPADGDLDVAYDTGIR